MGKKKDGPTEHKTFPSLALKFDEEQGIVEHIITVFGVLDHGDDVSHPGSFKKTIQERKSKVRVLDMHKTDSIMRALGKPLALREIGAGELPPEVKEKYPEATGALWAQTKFLLDVPEGRGAFVRLREGVVDEWSYGYDAVDMDFSTATKDGEEIRVRNLRQVRLWEYGPVLWGMNPATATLSAKSETPSESKPAPEVTENTIRIRVRDPGDFQEDSFRTIRIGGADSGIQATVGRPKGKTTMAVQSYVFDKDRWDVERAQAWVDEHKKSRDVELAYALYAEELQKPPDELTEEDKRKALEKQLTEDDAEAIVPVERDEGPYRCECLECGRVVEESEQHCRDAECPECGGAMRRAERPGPGKEEDGRAGSKAVSGRADWPLADRGRAWDAAQAERRIRSWAGAEDGPNEKYRSCHFWYDGENADNFTAYKLLFCDVVDGQVRAVPRGIFAVAVVLRGGRGGTTIPDADQARIRTKVSAYYARMRREFDDDGIVPPWEKADALAAQLKELAGDADIGALLGEHARLLDVEAEAMAMDGEGEPAAALTKDEKLRLIEGFMAEAQAIFREEKVGRVLSAANERRIVSALTALIQTLEAAGVDVPGYEKQPQVEKSAPDGAAPGSEAGPLQAPTSMMEVLEQELRLMEMEVQ